MEQSQEVLSVHFDPNRGPVDRADRLMKTREFVALLEFYLDRGERYGVLDGAAADEGRFLLRSLESGYTLLFTRSALIFDFEKDGTGVEHEAGIEYHRIGTNLIRELVDAAAPTAEDRSAPDVALALVPAAERSEGDLRRRRSRAPSIPTVSAAAFLGAARERTVDWEAKRTGSVAEDEVAVQASEAPTPPEPPALLPETPRAPKEEAQRPREPKKDRAPEARPDRGQREAEAPVSLPALDESAPPSAPDVGSPVVAVDGGATTARNERASEDTPGGPEFDVMVGVMGGSPQYGLLGEVSGRTVAIDLNQTHTISLFGVQGGGKSYTLGSLVEMASLPIDGINELPNPLASVIFHYSPTMDYAPEFTTMVRANSEAAQVASLRERYGAEPKALSDVVMMVPADKLDERRLEYPSIEVHPLQFSASELQASHWRFLMGAVGNQATYIRQLNRIMKKLRDDLTLDGLRKAIDDSRMPDHIKELAHGRLELAEEFIDDGSNLGQLLRPGRLVIVDLRDEFMEKDQALGLFVVLLQLFAEVTHEGKKFNKLVVFDEAHKYIESPDLVAGLVEVVREMRHKGTSILVASQDPPSVPVALIELSSQIILHKFNSPAWLKHIQKANAALAGLTPQRMAHLKPGEAYVWSSKASDDAFSKGALKVRCRPRVTQHGGATKTAVGG